MGLMSLPLFLLLSFPPLFLSPLFLSSCVLYLPSPRSLHYPPTHHSPLSRFFIPPSPIVLSRLKTISIENRNRLENPTQAKGVKKKKGTKKGAKKRIEAGDKKQNQIGRFQTAQNSQNQTADKTIKQQKQNLEMRKSRKRSKRGRHLRTHLDNPPP